MPSVVRSWAKWEAGPSHLACQRSAQSKRVAAVGIIVVLSLVFARLANAVQLLNVTLAPDVAGDAAGRLLVFAEPVAAGHDSGVVDGSVLQPTTVAVAGQDVRTFGLDRRVTVDLDQDASQEGFSNLPTGDYRMQVVLDPDGDYGHDGRDAGDILSDVTVVHLPLAAGVAIPLQHILPQVDIWNPLDASADERSRLALAKPLLTDFVIESPLLSAYWGRPVHLQAWVLVPTDYDAHGAKTWPVVYVCGTGSSGYSQNLSLASLVAQMNQRQNVPKMIWVFLNYATQTGTTEFADSANNGPWEAALLRELVPALENRFRMDAKPSSRFLTGHSSGGWASIWLETRHPDFFGGAWATAPDPVDFHDFVGIDLYDPSANMFVDARGHLRPLVRAHGEVTATLRDWVRLEEVLGHTGGTFQSFESVFSPRAPDGTAARLFDRVTGAVNPTVAAYWRDHYDISLQIDHMKTGVRRKLSGKLHVTVGDVDTFYLTGSVQKLQSELQRRAVAADIHVIPGKNHNNLYGPRENPLALLGEFSRAMYESARPKRSSVHKSQEDAQGSRETLLSQRTATVPVP